MMQTNGAQFVIETAFQEDVNLKKRVFDAIRDTPQHAYLFVDIAHHIERVRTKTVSNDNLLDQHDERAHKKRKLEGVGMPNHVGSENANGLAPNIGGAQNFNYKVIFEAKDLSFQLPLRKKLHVQIARECDPNKGEKFTDIFIIRTRNPASDEIEYEMQANIFVHVLRLPVPEKAQKQYNYCLIPDMGFVAEGKATRDGSTNEPLVWTANHGAKIAYETHDQELEQQISNNPDRIIEEALEYAMQKNKTKVTLPDEAEFASATPESHRKGEKAYHVKAFRGSKDGFLFFLSSGIFFGFKKPLHFFPLNDIKSISYTSVLQRTFNLNIEYEILDPTPQDREVEFSMLDQADFAGIDAYVKRHGLQDASMAEARKAKRMNINGAKKGATDQHQASSTHVEEEEEPGELEKARQEIEDAEDEEEEDYDPGSEGESDGSGSSSEEEDEYAAGTAHEADLVADELGSEAEEVEPEPDVDDDDQL